MVETQLRTREIQDKRVLNTMTKIPRHVFVPEYLQDSAYADAPLPIGWDQTISQPYIAAYMTEMLQIRPEDRVLEIGTGSGYQTAVLADLAREVYTVEFLEMLSQRAKSTLDSLGYRNIYFRIGDGWQGWPEPAPYDKIMVTAAPHQVPPDLVDQLRDGGRMVLPVGVSNQQIKVGVKKDGNFQTVETIPVRFVPLVKAKSEEKRQPETRI